LDSVVKAVESFVKVCNARTKRRVDVGIGEGLKPLNEQPLDLA
jgi:hypothetical protein